MEYNIAKIYALERAILDMSAEEEERKASAAQEEYNLRNAKAALLEYEGSLRSFLDKLKGTRESRLEQLQRSFNRAQTALAQERHRLEVLGLNLMQVKSERAGYPLLTALPDCREKYVQEAYLCIHVLAPMLEDLQEKMLACRDLEQGRRAGEILSIAERQEVLSAPVNLGVDCGTWLTRLERALSGLDIPFSIPEFYRNPAVYLAATQYTRRDRLNEALDQTIQLKKQLPKLKNNVKE